MRWDIEWYDDDTLTGYRIAVGRMTIAGSIAAEVEQDRLAADENLKGRLLLRLLDFALLRQVSRIERCQVEGVGPDEDGNLIWPETTTWQQVNLDRQEMFLDLPDLLFWLWWGAFIQKNPQYDRSYEVLKKNALMARPQTENNSATGKS